MPEENDPTFEIKIVFYSTLKKIAQKEKITIKFERGTTLQEILELIQQEFFTPQESRILKANNQDLAVGMICLINDVDYNLKGGFRYKFYKPATVTLISSIHGG